MAALRRGVTSSGRRWSGEADPCAGRKDLEATADPAHDTHAAVLTAWHACYRSQAVTLKTVLQDLGIHTPALPPGAMLAGGACPFARLERVEHMCRSRRTSTPAWPAGAALRLEVRQHGAGTAARLSTLCRGLARVGGSAGSHPGRAGAASMSREQAGLLARAARHAPAGRSPEEGSCSGAREAAHL